jgi:hypothetical protein
LSPDCPHCPSESGVQTFVPTNFSEWIGVKEVARLTFMYGNRAATSAPALASAPALETLTAPPDLPHPNRAYTVNLVSPVRNNERNIAWVLERIAEDVDEIIVVDGDSTDTTYITAVSELLSRRRGAAPARVHAGQPPHTSDPRMERSAQAGTRGKLNAEPLR